MRVNRIESCVYRDIKNDDADTNNRTLTVNPEFDHWITDFFDFYYRRSPVNATFIGVHDFDDRLPDFSEPGLDATLSEIRALLDRAEDLPTQALTFAQVIDKRLCSGFLKLQQWEMESGRFHQSNPSLYAGEAIFGVMSLFLADFAPLCDRVKSATARLRATPGFLVQARQNLRECPQAWCAQAIDECDGALFFLGDDALRAAATDCTDDYRNAVKDAARAFAGFRDYLQSRHATAGRPADGCGSDALSLHLREAHCVNESAEALAAYARNELEKARSALAGACGAFGANDPATALAALQDLHPDVSHYYECYDQTWRDMKRLAETNDLVSWPDFPIRYTPQPDWAQRAAPHLYFLNYRSPSAFRRPPIHDYLVQPIETSMPAAEQLARLRANNDSVIKLNHVVHHGGIGHHIQNWHAFRAESRVGRIAAVDCVSRIAMHCGGTMAEGWACYATDLVAEFGGMTPLEELAEIHTRVRMCSRALVDIGFHSGELTFDQAVELYEQQAGMTKSAAVRETTRNSMYPASALMYVIGTDEIHKLRRDLETRDGSGFDLRGFHDRFLSHGSIPVTLIAASMREAQYQGQ